MRESIQVETVCGQEHSASMCSGSEGHPGFNGSDSSILVSNGWSQSEIPCCSPDRSLSLILQCFFY